MKTDTEILDWLSFLAKKSWGNNQPLILTIPQNATNLRDACVYVMEMYDTFRK